MKAVRATYKNGRVKLSQMPPDRGPVDVLVVFPEPSDAWQSILNERKARPAFTKFARQCMREIAEGKAKLLKLDSRKIA